MIDRLEGYKLSSGHVLHVARYSHGNRFAIRADTANGLPECHVSVNLEDSLEDDEFFVRFMTRDLSKAVFEAMIKDGIADPTGRIVSSGHVEDYAEVWRLAEEKA